MVKNKPRHSYDLPQELENNNVSEAFTTDFDSSPQSVVAAVRDPGQGLRNYSIPPFAALLKISECTIQDLQQ